MIMAAVATTGSLSMIHRSLAKTTGDGAISVRGSATPVIPHPVNAQAVGTMTTLEAGIIAWGTVPSDFLGRTNGSGAISVRAWPTRAALYLDLVPQVAIMTTPAVPIIP